MEQEHHQSDLKLALKRITDLQAALEEDIDSDSDALISDRSVSTVNWFIPNILAGDYHSYYRRKYTKVFEINVNSKIIDKI